MIACPKCGKGLIERTNRFDGRKFLACPGYPNCRHTQSVSSNGESHSPNGKRKEFNPTDEQRIIIDDIVSGETHLFIQAGPGCSKSTTARESLHAYLASHPDAITKYTCFNKSIATEFSKQCPARTNVSTMHSFGFGILRNAFPDMGKPMVRKGEKTEAILRIMADSDKGLSALLNDETKGPLFIGSAIALIAHCKGHLYSGENQEELAELCDRFGIDGEACFPYIPEIMEWSKTFTVNDQLMIDFDDMIYLPVILDLDFGKCDIVVVDEGQDLNYCKQAFAMRLASNGRVVFIGDEHQSINGFTGADCRSMQTMLGMLQESPRGVTIRELSITFRCPKSHVRMLNQKYPDNHLRCLDNQREGSIEEIGVDQVMEELQAGDMILCRVNAPLIKWFFKLLKARKRAIIIGRKDEVDSLINAIKALKAKTIPSLLTKIEKARDKEINRIKASGKPSLHLIEGTNDKYDILREIASACKGVGEIESVIRSMFEETVTDDRIRLSSVHRAKGMESDGVFILHPELIPHPKAETPEELQQEKNVGWVAYSRSKDRLFIVY